jgi:hypothetical protein
MAQMTGLFVADLHHFIVTHDVPSGALRQG